MLTDILIGQRAHPMAILYSGYNWIARGQILNSNPEITWKACIFPGNYKTDLQNHHAHTRNIEYCTSIISIKKNTHTL